MIVAIDGPAGAGKSTTARAVAHRLGFLYLDTGAMYRAVALYFLQAGQPATPEAAATLLPTLHLDVRPDGDATQVFLGEEDITARLRTPEVSTMASAVGRLPSVRRQLVEAQQRIARTHAAQGGGVVMEGRDIGTVVFPEAEVKVFMRADPRVRAQRRQADLAQKGHDVPLERLQAEIEQRDRQDRERTHAPLRQAPDAVVLDTSTLQLPEQIDFVVALVKERRPASGV